MRNRQKGWCRRVNRGRECVWKLSGAFICAAAGCQHTRFSCCQPLFLSLHLSVVLSVLCSSPSFSVSYCTANIQLSSSSSTCPWRPAVICVFSPWWGGQALSVHCCFQFLHFSYAFILFNLYLGKVKRVSKVPVFQTT